jgi:transglutaminase-like putative cysteine protease
MATRTVRQSSAAPSFFQRIASGWRSFFYPGDITALLIVTALLLTVTLSLQAAEWPLAMGVILPITVFSALFGLILSRSQFNEFLALIISGTYGLCLVLIITAFHIGGGLATGVYEVFIRTVTWLVDVFTGGINQDDMVFTLLVASLFWFLGYNAAWHTFRLDRIWRVIVPPGLILATNAIFYTGDSSLEFYLMAFVFLALLLFVRSNLDAREWDWYLNGVRTPRKLRNQFLRVGALLALMTLIVGWSIPSGDLQDRLDSFQEFLQSDPLTDMAEFWSRLFSPIEAQGPTTADYYGGDSLELGGAIRLGDQTVLHVGAPTDRRYYWRSRVFDTYDYGRWTPAADTRLTASSAPLEINAEPNAARQPVQQQFTMMLNASRLVYTAPQPAQVDLPTRSDLFYTAPEGDPNRAMSISVVRPLQVIRRGQEYTAVSQMSTATAHQLRQATTDYPEWVRRLYFYVSPSVTPRTANLAREIVAEAGAVTVYDQSKAIESWLRANILYNEVIPRPPQNQDPVDWVLFDHREGYCNYYASAMIVMLRSLGIPARMAAGFAQGVYDAEVGAYVVTERDAHTWVEVYFPGYGWIEFEPTAAQAPLDREGDEAFSEQVIAPPPSTPTPTPTPTPLPTSTPEEEQEQDSVPPPPEQEDESVMPPTPTPTNTPTPTPTPTATPVIVPTQPAPTNPEAQSAFDFILPALGLLFGLILLVLLLIAIATFIYWWWEWRGMRGLSPVARAYARLERYLGLIGIQLSREQTPDERRRHIVKNVPQAERPVTAITRMYITERYGPGLRHPAQAQRNTEIADQAWTDARGNILQRWLRRFVPWLRD